MGISRNTVDYYEQRVKVSGLTLTQLLLLKDSELAQFIYSTSTTQVANSRQAEFDSQINYYLKELTRTGVTRQLLWQEYILSYPQGYAYTQFCERLNQGKRLRTVVMHLEHYPGETLQVDFAGKKLSYVDPFTKTKIECPVLVCVLPYSGLTYVEALSDATQENVYNSLSRVFRYFEGVTQSVLSDNMRQYVTKSNRYEPTFNELAEQWSVHYNTTLTAARVVKPRDKATVEITFTSLICEYLLLCATQFSTRWMRSILPLWSILRYTTIQQCNIPWLVDVNALNPKKKPL